MINTLLVSRYRIDAELGRGGMGVVYRAHDTLLDRPVAVKILSASGLGTEGRARLLREAQAVAKLDHPNIVAVHDAGEVDGTPFIVMQLVSGTSLREAGALSLSQVIELGRQMCDALEHAHEQGIVHRDLKPENIIVTLTPTPASSLTPGLDSALTPGPSPKMGEGEGRGVRAKLMDFGLALSRSASRLTEEGALVGTVFYLSPEQALGQEVDGRADLYSLGVVLYELAAGRPPFTGDNPVAVITQHLHAPVVPPSTHNAEIPPALDALILRLLSKQPAERPGSAAEVREALDAIGHLGASGAGIAAAEMLSPLDRIARGRLVGRERELAEAGAVWRRAVTGESGVLLISGEPGVGKTRLARELATHVEVSGGRVLAGECYAEGGGPYAPIEQIIQAVNLRNLQDTAGLSPSILADLITLAPSLRAQFPDVPSNPTLDPQAEQRRLFDSLLALCAALTARAPLLLVVEDAHWADSGTLFLLRYLARRSRAAKLPLLIVLTYREVELDEARALNEVLHDFNRERLATRIKLARLGREHTRDLLAGMFQEETTPEFLDGIYRETEGNPFFIEEVCKALIEDGTLYREGGRWRRPGMDQIHVPQSVRVAIQSRVGRLPEAHQETLKLAAILGHRFDFETLQAAGEQGEDALVDALERAERAQLVAEVDRAGGGTFAFAHALIPATLSEGVSGLRRRRMHRRAAAAIERLHPEDYEALAHHYEEAAEDEQARASYTRAGDRALATYANQEAEQHYRSALILAGAGPDRAALLSGLGEALQRQGRYDAALQAWREATSVYQSLGDSDSAARLFARSARVAFHAGDESGSLGLAREGLAAVAGQAETPTLAVLLNEAARAYHFNGLPDEAYALCRQALELAERLGLTPVVADVLATLGISPKLTPAEQLEILLRAVELAESAGLLETACRSHNNVGNVLYAFGNLRTARDHQRRAAEIGRTMRRPDWELFVSAYSASISLELGDFEAAESMRPALRELLSTLDQPGRPSASVTHFECLRLRMLGELAEAIRQLRDAQALARQRGELDQLIEFDELLAPILLELGRGQEAEEVLVEGIPINDRFGAAATLRCVLVSAQARQGRLEDARRTLSEAREKAGPQPVAPDAEWLALAGARLSAAEGRWHEALAAYETAADLQGKMGKRWYRAQTLREWAEAHVSRGETGDHEQARGLLQEALAVFEELNVPYYADLVRHRLQAVSTGGSG